MRISPIACVAGWLVATAPACEIVDVGPDVGVADRCVLAPSYYIATVVPDYLDKYKCANKAGCHRTSDGNSIYRLQDTSGTLAPSPTDPLSAWPQSWAENFLVTSAQVSDCDLAQLAPLYSEPAGGNTLSHGGGDLFTAGGAELDLIQAWLDGGN